MLAYAAGKLVMKKSLSIVLAVLFFLGAIAVVFRLPLVLFAISLQDTPPLLDKLALSAAERWFDDYYTVEEISPNTFAIGEPRYYQKNYSYLLLGETQALLFDSGTPVRNIAPVVASLTDKPVTTIASHLHYDHVGNHHRFSSVAMLDTAQTREQMVDGWFSPKNYQHLGYLEKFPAPSWHVSRWLQSGQVIDLGNRKITVIATPGHTDQSVSLMDVEQNLLFTGDFIYNGPLYAFFANSNLKDYLQSSQNLLSKTNRKTRFLAAHRSVTKATPALPSQDLPSQDISLQDLSDLKTTLTHIKGQTAVRAGIFPAAWTINEKLSILTDMPWLLDWQD